MSEYDKYVKAVNKIFEVIAKMKENWKGQDNLNYIASVEDYKQIVIDSSKNFSTSIKTSMEELGND